MNFEQTSQYIYSLALDFQQVGMKAYNAGLTKMHALDAHLQHPHRKFCSIHVAGTNGKGSVASMLAAVLQQAGYSVGLYTSPHLTRFTERIKVNGQEITEPAVVDFVARHRSLIEQVQPSFFELTTAMAFDYFAAQNVDYAVVEVGLGGRLDSTRIIAPMLSIITHIALDHCQILGDTLPQIAFEKGGIIQQRIPVVVGTWQQETHTVFEPIAQQNNAPLFFADQHYKVLHRSIDNGLQHFTVQDKSNNIQHFALDLLGNYQQKNLCTALMAIEILQAQGVSISAQDVATGLRQTAALTHLQGRWQILQKSPCIVCDIAHNADGLQQTMSQLAEYECDRRHIVLGLSADKDIAAIVRLLPREAVYYFTQAASARALPAVDLAQQCRAVGLQGTAYSTIKEAVAQAKLTAAANDLIYIGGSAFVVAEVLADV